jgi:hypothetical protein
MKLLAAIIIIFACLLPLKAANAAWAPFQATSSQTGNTGGVFIPLRIGAGGYVTNFQYANDGTLFARTDTAGADVCPPSQGKCRQVVTQASMPSANGLDGYGSLRGVCEIAIAPTISIIRFSPPIR